jgi:hypothetical protein
MLASRLVIVLLLMPVQSTLFAQVNLNTTAQGFSASALQEAKVMLKSFNEHQPYKILLSLSMFHLDSKKLRVDASQPISTSTVGDFVTSSLTEESDDISLHEFEELHRKSETKAQAIINSSPNKNNTLIINLTIALRVDSHDPLKIKSLYRFTMLSGPNVPASLKDHMNYYFSLPPDRASKLNFNDVTLRTNDAFIRDLLDHLSTAMSPGFITYDEKEKKSFDDNVRAKCEFFPSFQTLPVPGIPWKCIPATGVFTPIKVDIVSLNSGGPIQFRLTNTVDFKLQSPTPDANSQLWVSCNTKNKETAIIPTSHGIDIQIQKINVIAYEWVTKEVAVVLVEEENDDVQIIGEGKKNLKPDTIAIRPGPNKFLDTTPHYDDQIRQDPVSGDLVITPGPDGVCDTYAENTNLKPLDINLPEFERQLNAYYNQIMVKWIVHTTKYVKKINYDLNHDGLLNISTFSPKPGGGHIKNPSLEEDLVYNEGKKGITAQHYLFLVDRESVDEGILGRTTGNLESAILFTNAIKENVIESAVPDMIITTGAHELGHAAFKLIDHSRQSPDTRNLMAAGSVTLNEAHFRKFQWDIIHK